MLLSKTQLKQIKTFQKLLAKATSYDEWKTLALELDELEGKTYWKLNGHSDIYNHELLADRLNELRGYRERGDTKGLSRALREGLHHDLGNMGDIRLYQQCHFGTKKLVEDYIDEVCECLHYLKSASVEGLTPASKLDFFKDILLSFGRPALLLSGGASLGAFHIGVVKALWEQDLLPQVINGSSSGAIVAAALGTHTDEELPTLFDPETHNGKAWRWLGMKSAFDGRGLMDQQQLEDYIDSFVGDYTMQEAYERTGRSVNISVSPVQHHQKSRLLSGYTSPYILMSSAALASSAVPGIFPPVKLMKKDECGNHVPYMPRLRWVDGSVVSDLPIERLMHLYDVNYTIVSQTNPHIVPFLDAVRSKAEESSLMDLPLRWVKAQLKFHGKGISDYLRKNSDWELLRQVSGQAYSMMDQRYQGDVTISPHYKLKHYAKVMSNLTPEFVEELMLEGQRATWPKISMIRTHAQISQTLEACIAQLKQDVRTHRATLSVIA
jgi:TAG lipase/steryl ester hydrolase/phospholipase A2/LPA acyltransferase